MSLPLKVTEACEICGRKGRRLVQRAQMNVELCSIDKQTYTNVAEGRNAGSRLVPNVISHSPAPVQRTSCDLTSNSVRSAVDVPCSLSSLHQQPLLQALMQLWSRKAAGAGTCSSASLLSCPKTRFAAGYHNQARVSRATLDSCGRRQTQQAAAIMGLFGLKKNKGDAQPTTSSVAARATTVSAMCSTPALVPKGSVCFLGSCISCPQ